MRTKYEVMILNELFISPLKSRVDLSNSLKVNKTSISNSVNSLMKDGIVVESDYGESTPQGGRKPIKLSLNYEYAYFLGIDVSKKYISYALCNMDFEIKNYAIIKKNITSNNVIESICQIIDDNEDKCTFAGSNKLKGVAIAIHGIVIDNKAFFTPNYDIDKIDIGGELKSIYQNIEFDLINESNAAALCEYYLNPIDNLVVINVGTGVGAGIIINGKLLSGNHGYGGEIGHMIVEPGGKLCHCGNKGCFEQYCSTQADIDFYNSISEKKINSSEELIEKYKSGDENAIKTVERNIFYMSIGINNILKTIDADVIFVNSDLAYNIPCYIKSLIKSVDKYFLHEVNLRVSKFNEKSTIIGCVYYSITNFFKNDAS